MADKWPLANGNWSDAANWNGGTLPLAGDDVYADGRQVTIDQDVTVASIRTTQRSGGTAGGAFLISSIRTINANVIAGTGFGLNIQSGATNVTVIGNVFGGSSAQIDGVSIFATNATVNIIGNVSATNGASAYGLRLRTDAGANTVVNVVGDAYGDAGSNVAGVHNGGTGTINVTGNVYGGNGTNGSFGIDNIASGTINVTGNCEAKQSNAVRNNSTGTININGTVIGSQNGWTAAGATNISSGTMTITRAKGNGFGNGSIGLFSAFAVTNSQTGTVEVEEIEFGDLGNSPTSGPIQFKNITGNKCIVYRPSLAKKTLVDPSTAGDYPANANVRSGTVFNFGNSTGTLAIPNPNQVAVGVATDNTVGTAVITEASLLPFLAQTLSPNSPVAVQRTVDDNKAITFSWPVSGATITGEKSVDNGSYSAVVGAIAFLRTESGRHYYTLAYNAADRLSVEGTIRYKMTDGIYTKYFNLRLIPPGITPQEIQQELDDDFQSVLTAVGNIEVDNAAIADAVWNKDISGAAGSTAGAYLKDIWGRITAAVYQIFQDLSTMITGSGTADAQWTVNALENNPSGSVIVYPTQLQAEDRNVEGPIKIYTGESGEQFFHAIDADQNPIDLTGITLELRFGDSTSKNILYTAKTSDNTIVVSDTNKVTFTKSVNFTRFELSTLVYSLRNMDEGSEVILRGPVKLIWAP